MIHTNCNLTQAPTIASLNLVTKFRTTDEFEYRLKNFIDLANLDGMSEFDIMQCIAMALSRAMISALSHLNKEDLLPILMADRGTHPEEDRLIDDKVLENLINQVTSKYSPRIKPKALEAICSVSSSGEVGKLMLPLLEARLTKEGGDLIKTNYSDYQLKVINVISNGGLGPVTCEDFDEIFA